MLLLGDFFWGVALIRILIKVLKVLIARQLRNPGWLNSFLLHNIPVDALEPRVRFNILCFVAKAAKSSCDVLFQKAYNQFTCRHGHILWEFVISYCNSSINLVRVRIIERRVPIRVFRRMMSTYNCLWILLVRVTIPKISILW